jgi:hypothetical protein
VEILEVDSLRTIAQNLADPNENQQHYSVLQLNDHQNAFLCSIYKSNNNNKTN